MTKRNRKRLSRTEVLTRLTDLLLRACPSGTSLTGWAIKYAPGMRRAIDRLMAQQAKDKPLPPITEESLALAFGSPNAPITPEQWIAVFQDEEVKLNTRADRGLLAEHRDQDKWADEAAQVVVEHRHTTYADYPDDLLAAHPPLSPEGLHLVMRII